LACVALIYGALLLHESVSINAVGGLALILVGILFAGKKVTAPKAQQERVSLRKQ